MQTAPDSRIATVREFNRFYTRLIGVVRQSYLGTDYSLTEARVLYELAHSDTLTATKIGTDLDLDPGYLSRMLRRFESEGLLRRQPSSADRRQHTLRLTEAGRAAFELLDTNSRERTGAMLGALPAAAQKELVRCMGSIMGLLSGRSDPNVTLRHPVAGDIGWVIARHGALYADEYNFNEKFEALVAEVAGAFLANHDPARERCWIAECGGIRIGSVFLVRQTNEIGKLRLLLVEPSARGLGVGRNLVTKCISFAGRAGYRKVILWTNDILVAARGIYRAAGFSLIASSPHSDFGPPMVGEEWELTL